MNLFVALVHYPVVNRHGEIVTASVTNMDLHDIARSGATFGVKRYFVVHPSPDEQALNQRILHHWETGYGKKAHPTRAEALAMTELVFSFEEVLIKIKEMTGEAPLKLGTSAKKGNATLPTEAISKQTRPLLLVFGTAYGLAPSWQNELDGFLEPIEGVSSYNHLSVRSAVAIYLDRICQSMQKTGSER